MELFRSTIRVRPSVAHPLYYDWQFGYLSIWLFGESSDDASERAEQILEQLPYETVGEWSKCQAANAVAPESEKVAAAEKEAAQMGLALHLDCFATGLDEGSFAE